MKTCLILICLLGVMSAAVAMSISNYNYTPTQNYNYGEVLGLSLLFYEAQRSGRLPSNNHIPWRGDAMLNDRGNNGEDLSGGYFDAGDHVKFGFPMASFTTIIGWGALDYANAYASTNNLNGVRELIRWSANYLINAHPSPRELYVQVGDGNADHAYWGRPEDWTGYRPPFKITVDRPGSDIAGETAAALAASFLIFRDNDPFLADTCLNHARQLYDFADQNRGNYSDSVPEAEPFYKSWSGFGDELVWAAAWMYRATTEQRYLDDFNRFYTEFELNSRPKEFGWDNKQAGAQILMAKLTGDPEYKRAAEAFCDWVVDEAPRSPKGMVYIDPWGTLRHAGNVAFACLQAADAGINPEKYRTFARQQIGYILGDTGRSFVCGYGNNPPVRPHHRGSSCPNRPEPCTYENAMNNPGPNYQVLYGALVGGPDLEDNYEDRREDFVHNEVATDYNAGFQSALAGLLSI